MDTLKRFSDRVENYIKYRPNYPDEVISFLKQQRMLNDQTIIADVGSGTGISAELFLKQGNTVYGIEPNKEMREAAERLLKKYKNFNSIDAAAEVTRMEEHSVELIIAGQAFHWFHKQQCKKEFQRILKPGGSIVLMWNDRRTDTGPFLVAYEAFIEMFATDYADVNHKQIDEKIFNDFFGAHNYKMRSFFNSQCMDLQGLKGRVLSSSYMPNEGHRDFGRMINALEKLFDQFQEGGKVCIEYDTKIYYGTIKQ